MSNLRGNELTLSGNFQGNAEVFCELPHKSKKHPARNFCETCDLNLCKQCFNTHRKDKDTNQHWIWETTKTQEIHQDVIYEIEKCEIHKNDEIKYYCGQCDETVCEICSHTLHKDHGKTEYIADIAIHFDETKEFQEHYDKIRTLQTDLELDKSQYKTHSSVVEKQSTDALKAIKTQRDEMNQFYDHLQDKVTKEVQSRQEENLEKLKSLENENTAIAQELKELKAKFNHHAKNEQPNQLFIAMKKSKSRVQDLEAEVNKIKTEKKEVWYIYERNPLIVDLTRNVTKFGRTVETTGKQVKVLTSYTAQSKGELNLNEGEIINLIDMQDDDQWKGELDNKIGVFPKSHVELLTEDGYLQPQPSSVSQTSVISQHDDKDYEEVDWSEKSCNSGDP